MTSGSKYCVELSRLNSDIKAGGKAESLYSLAKNNIPVPQSIVITTRAFEDYSKQANPAIRHIVANLDHDIASISKACNRIRAILLEMGIHESIWPSVYRSIADRFGDTELIFRSSALGEDSEHHSFAGQLDSIVIRRDESFEKSCHEALLNVWISYWGLRSITYQINRGSILGGLAVIVQPYIRGKLSGVLFTQPPVPVRRSNGESPMILETVHGEGDKLVSGRSDPDRYYIYSKAGHVTLEPSDERLKARLNSIETLINISGNIVKTTGTHQDIEWTIDSQNRLCILQARYITSGRKKIIGDKQNIHVWSSANVNENYPEALTPFLMSFAKEGYYYYFHNLSRMLGLSRRLQKALQPAFRTIIDFHNNRMYYNLTNIYQCLSASPFPHLAKEYWDRFIGIYDLEIEDLSEQMLTRNGCGRIVDSIRIGLASLKNILLLPLHVRSFENYIERHISSCHKKNDGHSIEGHKNDLKRFIDIRFHRWKQASLADALAMFGYGFLRSAIEYFSPNRSKEIHHLLVGISNLVSHESQQWLWELSQMIKNQGDLHTLFLNNSSSDVLKALPADRRFEVFYRSFEDYQKKWGCRISGELLLTRPDYGEAPEGLIQLLRGYLEQQISSPAEQVEIQALKRKRLSREIIEHGRSRFRITSFFPNVIVCLTIFLAHQGIRYRERVRYKQSRLYNQCRRSLLSLGAILQDRDVIENSEDILFLKYQEIESLSVCHLPFPLKEVVRRRRDRYNLCSQTSPPETFTLDAGQYFSFDKHEDLGKVTVGHNQVSYGLSACEGRVRGRIRVLEDISLIERIQKGDILVTRQTDPGWAPAFPLIAGLILERGGMLSHGAIIAREYGIPAIVGLKEATTVFEDGEIVLLDADQCAVYREQAL